MFSLVIPISQLSAAVFLSAKKDVRSQLNGVFFDARSFNLVATDGNAMYVGRPGTVVSTADLVRDVILPIEFMVDVVTYAKKARLQDIVLEITEGFVKRPDGAQAALVEGTYPDWRRIYPSDTASEAIGYYDGVLLSKVEKANKALGAKRPGMFTLRQYGETSPGVAILQQGEAHVVVMPFRHRASGRPVFERFAV